jgi:hypothetical protein
VISGAGCGASPSTPVVAFTRLAVGDGIFAGAATAIEKPRTKKRNCRAAGNGTARGAALAAFSEIAAKREGKV